MSGYEGYPNGGDANQPYGYGGDGSSVPVPDIPGQFTQPLYPPIAENYGSISEQVPFTTVPLDNPLHNEPGVLIGGKYLSFKSQRTEDYFVKKSKHRTIKLIRVEDSQLFDEIVQAYNDLASTTSPYRKLMEDFCERENGDAIVKLVCGAPFYDYVIKHPIETKCQDHVTKRDAFIYNLLSKNVFVDMEKSLDQKYMYVKLVMPFGVLLEQAERMKLKFIINHDIEVVADDDMPLLQPLIKNLMEEVDPNQKPMSYFRKEKLTMYDGGDHRVLGLANVQQNFFSTRQRILLTYYFVTKITVNSMKKHQKHMGIRQMLAHGIFSEFYPHHDGTWKPNEENKNQRAELMRTWASKKLTRQPLNLINEYFGEKVAFYFAWMGTYTAFLGIAALIGVIVTLTSIRQAVESGNTGFAAFMVLFDSDANLAYTIIMSIWSTIFLEYWKRKECSLAFKWHVREFEKEEVRRAEFKATAVRKSPITGAWEFYDPPIKAKSKQFISALVVLVCMCIVILSIALTTWIRIALSRFNDAWVPIVTSLIQVVMIVILGMLYNMIAVKLNNWENHPTESAYENAFVTKKFFFDFFNSYSALLYIGIFKTPMLEYFNSPDICSKVSCEDQGNVTFCQQNSCMSDLTLQLAITFIGKQFIMQIIEIALPMLMKEFAKFTEKKAAEKQAARGDNISQSRDGLNDLMRDEVNHPQYVKDDSLQRYDSVTSDYLEMILQFGFVMLFVSSFPLGPLFAFINNLIEIRTDAWKLLKDYQRPIPYSASNIGAWFKILETVSFIAVITNASLIAFTSKHFYNSYLAQYHENPWARFAIQVVFVILYEHVVVGFKMLFGYVIPDVPKKVEEAIKREEYIADVMLEGEPKVEDDPDAVAMVNDHPEKYGSQLTQRPPQNTMKSSEV